MIIPNGYIKIRIATGGGFQNGIPQKATILLSDFIEANINESNRSHGQIGEETKGTKATYTILIDPYWREDIWSDLEVLTDSCFSLGIWKSAYPWKGLIRWVSGEPANEVAPLNMARSITPNASQPGEGELAVNDKDEVEVYDSRKMHLGTFDVQSARFLEYADVIRIQV